jgi:hypothetical protein
MLPLLNERFSTLKLSIACPSLQELHIQEGKFRQP